MDVFAIGFVATILFATSLGFWLALRETTCVESKPPKKYFSLLRTSLIKIERFHKLLLPKRI